LTSVIWPNATPLTCASRNSALHYPDLEVNVIDLKKDEISTKGATMRSAALVTIRNYRATMVSNLDGLTIVAAQVTRGRP